MKVGYTKREKRYLSPVNAAGCVNVKRQTIWSHQPSLLPTGRCPFSFLRKSAMRIASQSSAQIYACCVKLERNIEQQATTAVPRSYSPHLCVGFLFLVVRSRLLLPPSLPPAPPAVSLSLTHTTYSLTHTQLVHTRLTHIQHTHTTFSHTQLNHTEHTHHAQLSHTQHTHTLDKNGSL